jgi:uncharacterized SAM-binding protein YcdF (DUF218 family)
MTNNPTIQSIPRNPEVPALSPDAVRRITRLVFMPEDDSPSDLLFIFGSGQGDWERYAHFVTSGKARHAVVTGGVFPEYFDGTVSLAQGMSLQLLHHGVRTEQILRQDCSMNTKEDVEFSLAILAESGIMPQTLTFASKAHHSGRCFLTLKKYLPTIPLKAITCHATYQDVAIRPHDWWQYPISASLVYGEYLRILAYSQRGDIATRLI